MWIDSSSSSSNSQRRRRRRRKRRRRRRRKNSFHLQFYPDLSIKDAAVVGLLDKKEKLELNMGTARIVDTSTLGISTGHTKWPGHINTAVISSRLFRVNRRCCIWVASLPRLGHRCFIGSSSFYGLNYPLLAEIVNCLRELLTLFRYRLP